MGRFESPFQHEAGAHLPALTHGTLALAGGRLHYVEAGSGSPLLLIHGGHGSWTHWIANIEALARTHRVIAVDMPGFGGSYRPQPDYTIEQYVDVVIEVLDSLGIDDALVDRMLANVRLTKFVSRDLSGAARTQEWLAGIRQPILVFIGREDIHRRFGLAGGLQAIARHAPHAQIHLVERAAHWLQFDRAELFNSLVADFLR